MQAGATEVRPVANPRPSTAASCLTSFRVAFVTDVAGTQSAVDADGWRGVSGALQKLPCARAERIVSHRPSDYRGNLQAAADHHDDLVIAGSFLLTDGVVAAASANPRTHFVLVDPLVVPADLPNLTVLTFRQDQAAFLAGALAAMVSRTGIVAGVYGPGGAADQSNRTGFERGARYARPDVRVLGAFQPPDAGAPYANPAWGSAQAETFLRQGTDVIFGAGGTTGVGALRATAQVGRLCIAADAAAAADPAVAPCLLTSTAAFIDLGVKQEVADSAAGRWTGGIRDLGLAEHAVGLSPLTNPRLTPEIRQRLQTISDLLASGALATGV